MTEASADSYKYAFRDIVYELLEHARAMKPGGDVAEHTAMLYVLGLIKDQSVNFELDLQFLGLEKFDPEKWYWELSVPDPSISN